MVVLRAASKLLPGLALLGALFAFQRPFRQYPGVEYDDFPLPPDWQQKTEFAFARLMYPQVAADSAASARTAMAIGAAAYSIWTQDYPRADRHFSQAVRRLTRVDMRSVEQPVNLDDGDDVYNWPWLYAVQTGRWNLTDEQAAKLRDYLLRGGFFMCDDFWGEPDWDVFMQSMQRVFPDREWWTSTTAIPIFHVIYDLDDRYQVPGARYLSTGVTEKCEGCPAALAGNL